MFIFFRFYWFYIRRRYKEKSRNLQVNYKNRVVIHVSVSQKSPIIFIEPKIKNLIEACLIKWSALQYLHVVTTMEDDGHLAFIPISCLLPEIAKYIATSPPNIIDLQKGFWTVWGQFAWIRSFAVKQVLRAGLSSKYHWRSLLQFWCLETSWWHCYGKQLLSHRDYDL